MPGILWNSAEEREREWLLAKERLSLQGELLPNGTKLRRKDHPGALNHSFMVMDGRIIALSGKSIHLGSGAYAHAKLAEDEAGDLIALKIVGRDDVQSNSARESLIASDLGIAGQRVTRSSVSIKFPTKHYIAYQYLGRCLFDYLQENKSLSLDKRYELCIKISLALHEIHTGKKAKSKTPYEHNDIHFGNLVIDAQGEPHFIDFGRARYSYGSYVGDIVAMLLLFFAPEHNRDIQHEEWIFGDWLGEYQFSYSPAKLNSGEVRDDIKNQRIYIYLDQNDKNTEGKFPIIRYAVLDPYGVFKEGLLRLSDIGLDSIEPNNKQLRFTDLDRRKREFIENAVLEDTNNKGYTPRQENKNQTLFNLLKDPSAFYKKPEIPTALDIAETLTLCRLQSEAYQDSLATHPPDLRLEIIQTLNSISPELLRLYEQLRSLPNADNLAKLVKIFIFSHLLTLPKEISEDSFNFLNLQRDETHTIKQSLEDILNKINHTREAWRAKITPVPQDEQNQQQSQSNSSEVIKLEESSTEVVLPVATKLVAEELVTAVSHDTPKPRDTHEELNTTSSDSPTQIMDKPDISPPAISDENPEFIIQEGQTHVQHTITRLAGSSLVLGLGGAAVLTAGVGFFADRDTGLAGAVSNFEEKSSKFFK